MHVAASTGRMVAGRYLLQNTIGRGAMGTVWRARDTVLARDVAVKEVRLRGPVNGSSVMTEETRVLYQRTLREARTAARLNHPAVVTIFDVVEADGSPWIVMELVEARSLDQVLTEEGPLPPHQAADLGMRVLGALACAHAAGILHRDVKPSNVLLGPGGRAVLTDFGIATLEGDSGLTQAGMVMGTPGFTAPERIRGDPASPASDLWSLGATLYAAVEGRGPFDDRGNSIAILAAIANEEAPRTRSAGPLRPVIEALLRRNPQARPDAAAVGRLLAAAGTGTASAAARSGDAGRRAAGAGAPLLAAPVDLDVAGPQTQAPDGDVSWAGAPSPDGPWADGPWADGPWADGPWADGPWAGTPSPDGTPGGPSSGSQGSPSRGPQILAPGSRARAGRWPEDPWAGGGAHPGDAPWAGRAAQPGGGPPPARSLPARSLPGREGTGRSLSSRTLAGRPLTGRHGATAPGLRRGLAAELTGMIPRGRRGLLVLLGALAIVGAGILTGVVLTRGGSGAAAGTPGSPAVPPGQAGSAAGFRMAVPAGWHTAYQGAGTEFTSPAGDVSILVTPTPTATGGLTALGQVRRQLAQIVAQGRFPGYAPLGRRPFTVQGAAGVAWQFTWQPAGGGRMDVRDIVVRLTTPAGHHAYLVQESAPAAAWTVTQPVFRTALSTFRARS